ncbi:MAG: hypothetical protein ACFCGT_18380 [Sandaracinaceae bacterium]
MGRARWVAGRGALAGALLLACTGEAEAPGRMRALAEPHLAEMASFDRWARRLGLGDGAFSSEDAMREAAFAPLRRRGRAVAAWVHREGVDGLRLAYPDPSLELPRSGWVRVRTDELGELRVAEHPLDLPAGAGPWLLLARTRPAPGEATLRVVLAFPPLPEVER